MSNTWRLYSFFNSHTAFQGILFYHMMLEQNKYPHMLLDAEIPMAKIWYEYSWDILFLFAT